MTKPDKRKPLLFSRANLHTLLHLDLISSLFPFLRAVRLILHLCCSSIALDLTNHMATSVGIVGSSSTPSCWFGGRGSKNNVKKKQKSLQVVNVASGGLTDEYRRLRIRPGASEMEVKKAFRQLALQYHPDVCKGSNCGVQFHRINEAYEMVMRSLREQEEEPVDGSWSDDDDGHMRGMYDSEWDLWEEWMGWEGAGIRDYSSHINPYI